MTPGKPGKAAREMEKEQDSRPGTGKFSLTVKEYFQVHRILAAIVEHKVGSLRIIPQSAQKLLQTGESDLPNETITATRYQWLELLDLAVTPYDLRAYVVEKSLDEQSLRLLVRFHVAKPAHLRVDVEKVDWLLTYLFRLREQQNPSQGGWYRDQIEELLQGFEAGPLSPREEQLLAEIAPLLEEVKDAETFSRITGSRLVERGRELKNQLGEGFFDPTVLAAVVNYNLLLEKKFQRLFREAAQQVPETDELRETLLADPDKALQMDYLAIANALWHVGELEKERRMEGEAQRQKEKELRQKAQAAVGMVAAGPAQAESLEKRLLRRGIDPGRQAERLRVRVRDVASRFPQTSGSANLRTSLKTILLEEWELAALRQNYPEADESFRAKLAREITIAVGVVVSVQEELHDYYESRATEHLWKPHCEALFYLLHEGRRCQQALEKLAAESKTRGLLEKSGQISQTLSKLVSALAEVSALSEPAWLQEPLP